MRPVKAYTIVTVLVILLHILRLNNTNKYIPKQEVIINGFVLMQHSPTCWYVREQLLFKLNQCREYELGSNLSLIGTVEAPSDSPPSTLNILAISEVRVTSKPSELTWYHPNFIQSRLLQIREKLQQKLLLVFPKTEATLFFSVLFGGTSLIPEELKQAITYLGIQHIMAASGMQVTLLLLVLTPISKRFSRSSAFYIQCILLLLYAQLALMSVSIVRAIIQSIVNLLLLTFHKQRIMSWTILLTSLALLATLGTDSQLAFQLSFLAIIGLQFRYFLESAMSSERNHAHVKKTSWNELIKYIKEVVITSLYVQIWLFPFLCHYFGQVSGMSILATLCVVWLLTPLFLIGIPSMCLLSVVPLGFVQSPIILFLCWPLHNLLWLLNQLIRLLEVIPVPPVVVVFTTPLLISWYTGLLITFWWLDSRWLALLHQSDVEIIRKKY